MFGVLIIASILADIGKFVWKHLPKTPEVELLPPLPSWGGGRSFLKRPTLQMTVSNCSILRSMEIRNKRRSQILLTLTGALRSAVLRKFRLYTFIQRCRTRLRG